ncbi:hypothetical protein Godav_029707 [Gossypium davidsonii]|uniref:MADS-box domain-containing protein n=2 Tax=Gossypium TaxID=3633 RepID=A0A7J8T6M4_GOSDV|nr:hypothetical protein [Gossypium davidsonii]MBA0669831.1 hypothetical protein [Gossypium klotzschianum]
MIRKKVKLAYITNDSSRKATYNKRNKGLMKKMSELSTLCGINACAIMYSPYESQLEVWPSPIGSQQVLSKFKMILEMEHRKNMVNQERASSSSSLSMVALPLMMIVMPKAMSRTGTDDIVQSDVNNMDPMKRQQWIMDLMNRNNNNNPQTHVGGDWMMFQFGDNINPNNGH